MLITSTSLYLSASAPAVVSYIGNSGAIPKQADVTVKTFVKNIGNTAQTLFASTSFVIFNASTEEPIVSFALAPNEAINVTTTENSRFNSLST